MRSLSAVLITLNGGEVLGAALASLRFADEILVVDSGSTDDSVALAESFGARVLRQDWLGFGAQKQFAVEQARHDWVLCVDADERVTPELAASISRVLAEDAEPAAGYRLRRRNRFLGRWLNHGEGYPDWCLRLFDRRRGFFLPLPVHERVVVEGPVDTLTPGDLLHDSAADVAAYVAKQNHYSSLMAEEILRTGQRVTPWRAVSSPLARFAKFYLLRQGFRDGFPGLAHVSLGCLASFLKYMKVLEAQGRMRSGPAGEHRGEFQA